MAYVVLARKYRPQRFADLIGEEHVTRTLANAIANDRVHHAYLFCGGRGLGKTTTARLLAKCLVCVHGPTAEPCNECSECVAVTEGRSVDVIEIDGASNNRVDDVRNLRDQVRYLPQSARRKIYIIDEVHMLTGSAFNALLKTLEEPPEHVTFIFATTEVHELPATILSRVSRFDFRRLPSARLVEHMKSILANEGVEVEEAGLYLVARAGDGSVRDSLTLLDKVIAFASDTAKISAEEVRVVLGVPSQLAVADLASAVLARDAEATLQQLDEVVASGQDLQQLALAFLQHLRNLVVIKLTGSREVLIDASEAEYDHLRGEAEKVEVSVLCQLFDRFARVVDSLANTRVPRLLLEMGLLDLVHAEPLIPLGGLIDRLDEISRGAPGLSAVPRGSAREISSGRPAAPPSAQGSGSPPAPGRRDLAPAAAPRARLPRRRAPRGPPRRPDRRRTRRDPPPRPPSSAGARRAPRRRRWDLRLPQDRPGERDARRRLRRRRRARRAPRGARKALAAALLPLPRLLRPPPPPPARAPPIPPPPQAGRAPGRRRRRRSRLRDRSLPRSPAADPRRGDRLGRAPAL
ncbi:MAG: DNA polymerase III subunit gamma/tau [Myxococcales bacterium]|nr:DNA polymerase III subunit gamma/tau [Myxococcales bacterium]